MEDLADPEEEGPVPQEPVALAQAEPDPPPAELPVRLGNEIKPLPDEPVRPVSADRSSDSAPSVLPPRRHGGAVPE
jgi:hypothetical protein